jgi:putative oxidoreductase
MLRSSGIVVARILLGLLFFLGGVNMLMSGGGPAEMIANIGFPAAGLLAWVVVAVKVLGGAGLILGYRTGLSAAALFAFTLLTVVFVHADMEDPSLFKNLSIMGGLLYAMAYGPGEGWRLGK